MLGICILEYGKIANDRVGYQGTWIDLLYSPIKSTKNSNQEALGGKHAFYTA